jgi:hypothetical protein
MNSWTKEANDNDLKTTSVQCKKKAKGRLWKLIIVAEEPEGIPQLMMRCTMNCLHQAAKQMH